VTVLLFLLAVVWAIYLGSWLLSRRERRSVNSIGAFSKHLSILERTRPYGAPARTATAERSVRPTPIYASARYQAPQQMTLSAARRRRRNVLLALVGVSVGSFLLTPFFGTRLMVVFAISLCLLAGYVVLLLQTQRRAAERRTKVHYLPQLAPAPEPRFALQRSAN
jgi:hypothetical protein